MKPNSVAPRTPHEEAARQEFEKWADQQRNSGYPFPLELAKIGDDYKYSDTRFAWMIWQAAVGHFPSREPLGAPFGWWDTFNECLYRNESDAKLARDGGNEVIELFTCGR